MTNAVPAKASFVTNGHARDVQIGGRTICLRKAPSKLMPWINRPGAPVLQALIWLGKDVASDPSIVDALRMRLPDYVKRDLHKGIGDVPGWAQPIVRQVVAEDQIAA